MSNLLAAETSPYLLQHTDNPVQWHAWNEAALARARAEDKPILLSIGYSTCHWCHVMARESFEDADVAAAINRLFVPIKVDREERPDLDQIYQTALQLLTGRGGGWPLTLFLMPDGTPFFGGTYFPPRPRHNLPAFANVLEQVARAYARQRGEIERQNASLLAALARPAESVAGELDAGLLRQAIADIRQGFDPVHGGFSGVPKFPRPTELEFLLDSGDPEARRETLFTLEQMAAHGLMDHLGGALGARRHAQLREPGLASRRSTAARGAGGRARPRAGGGGGAARIGARRAAASGPRRQMPDGQARHNGYLDDSAFLIEAQIELAQAGWREADLAWARELATSMLSRFVDCDGGGFFFTSHDHERLIQRPKPAHDHAMPSGNGVAARLLGRLGLLPREPRWTEAAADTLRAFQPAIAAQPAAFPDLLMALREHLDPPSLVVLRGPDAELQAWKLAADRVASASTLIFAPPLTVDPLPAGLARPVSEWPVTHVCGEDKSLPEIVQLPDLLTILRLRTDA